MANPNETLHYNWVIESLEKAKAQQQIDKNTIKQAQEMLKNNTLSQQESLKVNELLSEVMHLNQEVSNKVSETKESVEMNATDILNKIEKINSSKDLQLLSPDLIKNLKKQLEYNKEKNPEIYLKLSNQLVELSNIYENQLQNDKVEKIPHLDELLQEQWKEFTNILDKNSLDLKNNSLENNLDLFKDEKNLNKKNLILDYIYQTEIINNNYRINSDENWKYSILDWDNSKVDTPEVNLFTKSVLLSDLNTLKIYQESEDSKIINTVPVLWDKTVAQIIEQSPLDTQKQYKKLSETTGAKLAPIALWAMFLFWLFTKEGWMWFGKRLGWLIGWGLLFSALNTSAKELWHDGIIESVLWSSFSDILDWSIWDAVVNKPEKLKPWDQEKSYVDKYKNILLENKTSPQPLSNDYIKSFFGFCYNSESFRLSSVSNIQNYLNNTWTVNITDIFWAEIPKYNSGENIPESEIKRFLSLLISQKDINDNNWNELLKQVNNSNTIPGWAYIKNSTDNSLSGWGSSAPETDESLAGGDSQNPETDESLVGGNSQNPETDESLAGGNSQNPEQNNSLNWWISENELKNKELIRYKTIWYLEPGKELFLAADRSDKSHFYEQLSVEMKESMFDYQEKTTKVENLLFIIQNISIDEDKPELNEKLKKQLIDWVNNVNIFDFKNTLPQLDNAILNVISRLPEDNLDLTDRMSVLNYVREQWNTSAVAREIVNKNFHELNISPEDLKKFINSWYKTEEIKKLLKEDPDLTEKISDKESEVKQYIAEIQDTILPEYKELYPDIDWSEILKNIQTSIIEGYAKWLLYETHLASKMSFLQINLNSTNAEANLFAEMKWVGTFDFSDENLEILTWELATFALVQAVAIWAGLLTMWAGTVAINAAVYGTRAGKLFKTLATTANLSRTWNWFIQWTKVLWAQTLRWWAMWVANWTSFYTGYAAVSWIDSDKLAHWELSYENAYSIDGFIDSAMFWVAWRAFQGLWLSNYLSKAWTLIAKRPILIWAPSLAWALGLHESLPESIQLEPGEWSKEEIISVLMFVWSFYLKIPKSQYSNAANHTAGQNFKFSKNNGNVQVQMWPPKPTKLQAQYPNMNNVQPLSKAKILAKKAKKAWNKIKDTLTFNN